MSLTPEAFARQQIDVQLVAAGWIIQDVKAVNLSASSGIALREVQPRPVPAISEALGDDVQTKTLKYLHGV